MVSPVTTGGARAIRASPIRRRRAILAAVLPGLLLLAGCGSDSIDREPAAPPAPAAPVYRAPPAGNPPSSFSTVVDESLRRKKVIEELRRARHESEP